MSISDAFVTVTCDRCGADSDYELTALAMHESYDMRNVRKEMAHDGWNLNGGDNALLCEGCVDELASATEDGES